MTSSSKLDKLLTLLEGDSSSLRNASSREISEITQHHPSSLQFVISKVAPLLYHKSWDIRTSAAHTISLISALQKKYEPVFVKLETPPVNFQPELTPLSAFSLEREKISGILLLSAPNVPSSKEDKSPITPKEKKRKQDFFSDLLNADVKKTKTIVTEQPKNEEKIVMETVIDENADDDKWPFQAIVDRFKIDLFSPNWEMRHGAALGLKEILKNHADGAAKTSWNDLKTNQENNELWLQDACVKILKIFVLDRFTDFVGDQAVAPVRETCGQILGIVLKFLSKEHVLTITNHLIKMSQEKTWEIAYNGLLGMKYTLAVRQDFAQDLLPKTFDVILNSLQGMEDEVACVAAEALIPVAEHVISMKKTQTTKLMTLLWDILLNLDDLSASTASVMALLAKLYSLQQDFELVEPIEKLIPRLWPFMRHNLSSVRKSTVNTLEKLFAGKNFERLKPIVGDVLRYLFQNIFLEENKEIVDATYKVWLLMTNFDSQTLISHLNQILHFWIYLLSTPFGQRFDYNLLLLPPAIRNVLSSGQRKDKKEKFTFNLRLLMEDTEEFMNARINASHALADLMSSCSNVDISLFWSAIKGLLTSSWASHKQIATILIEEVARINKIPVPQDLIDLMIAYLNQEVVYEEIMQLHTKMSDSCVSLLEIYQNQGINIDRFCDDIITLSAATEICSQLFETAKTNTKDLETLNKMVEVAVVAVNQYSDMSKRVDAMVHSHLSNALVFVKSISTVTNLVIKSLLNAIQTQRSVLLQDRSCDALSVLLLNMGEKENNVLIIETLCHLVCHTRDEMDSLTDGFYIQRGCKRALAKICQDFGSKLFEVLPTMWDQSALLIASQETKKNIIHGLYILGAMIPHLETSLLQKITPKLETMIDMLGNEEISSDLCMTISILVKHNTKNVIKVVIDRMLPLLVKDVSYRRGAAQTIEKIIQILDVEILPYVVFFIIPLLKRMSDQDAKTRSISTHCFGTLIKILPLQVNLPHDDELSKEKEREKMFIEQLLDASKIEPYEIPVKINAELRQYQKDGVSWLSFLNKFNLHGVLCDDMGLGKTLQTICILAGDSANRRKQFESTNSEEFRKLPNLVICPPTLINHWSDEIKKFTDMIPVQYVGTLPQRKKIRENLDSYDVVITSYDLLRNDVANLTSILFNYCILDEGHIIRNSKTKITKAVKQILANHRLILTGTPIQNEVLELWSMFDFLMPGFLGTEQEFNAKFSKPIQASKDAKPNSKEQEMGTMALEALHRQVLPFLLRRVKEDVLKDLPEKIIQDTICDLSPIQRLLYEDFATSEDQLITQAKGGEKEVPKHVFQTLQYARKLCDHPSLILDEKHPKYTHVQNLLASEKKTIHDISVSTKLVALLELLKDAVMGQHKVLIFSQLKVMLDIIETDLFKVHLPNLSWLRLDGSVESSKRHGIGTKFNGDPTIDVLLLTTRVGGLGLNLTSADTVIFISHDWNPSADLQAMDRAHRIGQTKCVNVYRLITRGTIEDKIMNLQQFKMNISKSVVNRENTSFKSLDPDALNTFAKPEEKKKKKSEDDLWDEDQYGFDMESYLKEQ